MNDLMHRVLRISELKRKYNKHETLTEEEMRLLKDGIPAEEYHTIIENIRAERRSAVPSKAAKAAKQKADRLSIVKTPIDLDKFMNDEHNI